VRAIGRRSKMSHNRNADRWVVGSPRGVAGLQKELGPPVPILCGFDFPKSAERGCDVSGKGIAACDSFRGRTASPQKLRSVIPKRR
jgi:hypothetical protein